MIENGFYKVKQEYIDLIKKLGGTYKDIKERPIYCCISDKYIKNLYWMIPTSDLSHRDGKQIAKINALITLPKRDIRSSWYYIGHTNRPAIYRISNCFPIIDKYIESEYTSQGIHLVLKNENDIQIIKSKLSMILLSEKKHPNKYEQHITSIKNYLIQEMEMEEYKQQAALTVEHNQNSLNNTI